MLEVGLREVLFSILFFVECFPSLFCWCLGRVEMVFLSFCERTCLDFVKFGFYCVALW